MRHNNIEILEDLPDTLALEAYKWFLNLVNKGQVSKLAEREGRVPYNNWKIIRNTIRTDPHALKLWKPFATYYIKKCEWCVYFKYGRCRRRSCSFMHKSSIRDKYKHSVVHVSKLFEVPVKEILFIKNRLSDEEIRELEKWVKSKVEVIILAEEEQAYYNKIYSTVYKKLNATGHFHSKVQKAYGIIKYRGEDSDDIKAQMYEKLAKMIRRYDYLSETKLILNCSRSLNNHIYNIIEAANAEKRKTNLKIGSIEEVGEDGDVKSHLENTSDDSLDLEESIIRKNSLESILDVVNDLDGELAKSVDVLMGKEDLEFIEFLKERKEIKTKASWAAYYDKVDPTRLMDLVNAAAGFSVNSAILKIAEKKNVKNTKKEKTTGDDSMAEKSVNDKLIGGTKMQKIKVTFPRKKCIMCAYWIPYLNKKKRTPPDCSPAYPGCPTHLYEMDWQFPIKSAAIQLRQFQIEGDNNAIKEFIDKTPAEYVSDIMDMAASLTDDDLEAVIIEEESEEEQLDLEEMDHAEMLAFVGQNDLADQIDNCYKLSEDDLREALQDLVDAADNDENEDEEADEEEDSAVIGKIQELGIDDEKK